mmetsp:Transcript_80735/g.168380  ORF Transcript_80735/g.168380 Transcript_80735/m.168380 type:complete len:1314 (-) Transcript_80735:305-4246(-)
MPLCPEVLARAQAQISGFKKSSDPSNGRSPAVLPPPPPPPKQSVGESLEADDNNSPAGSFSPQSSTKTPQKKSGSCLTPTSGSRGRSRSRSVPPASKGWGKGKGKGKGKWNWNDSPNRPRRGGSLPPPPRPDQGGQGGHPPRRAHSNQPTRARGQCWYGVECYRPNCQFQHPDGWKPSRGGRGSPRGRYPRAGSRQPSRGPPRYRSDREGEDCSRSRSRSPKKSRKDKKDKKDKKDSKEGKEDDDDLDSYLVTKAPELLWNGVGEDEFAFQLKFLGPHMARSVGNAPDPLKRVLFKPDKWQRDLLDIVDARRSAVISAPTASGKTFIGYYCMEQVLRYSDDGICVYVAPSKALVNQVSAEIYARFNSKTYERTTNSLNGVFIKEFNTVGGFREQGGWKDCQIAIMEPRMLELALLSPSMQNWVHRLRWIIFDEVHCIGDQEGTVWEHCIQACPCPFLALSATIANPSDFQGWLQRVSKAKALKNVELIVHSERWNDLYKYVYRSGALRPLHPFCCLTEDIVKKNGLPMDLTLTPVDLARLFEEVKAIVGDEPRWEALRPSVYFGKTHGFLTKRDVQTAYQKDMKKVFMDFLYEGILSGQKLVQLKNSLQMDPDHKAEFKPPARTDTEEAAEGEDSLLNMERGTGYQNGKKLLSVCRDLDKANCLPAIIFNFDRIECVRMCTNLATELKDLQFDKYYGDEEKQKKTKQLMEKRWADYEAAKKRYDNAQKAKESKNQEAKASRKAGEDKKGGDKSAKSTNVDEYLEHPAEPGDIADEIDEEFSFHSPQAYGRNYTYISDIMEDAKKAFAKAPALYEGLRRGVAVHHEAMGAEMRKCVEMLFRAGFLKVVFATHTLALGINMPCRTTVFCGHHLELNGVIFRQMSGRAGRRGFDLLGQVVFLDMSFRKITALLASDCPPLLGQFSLSSTLLLRSLLNWEVVRLMRDYGFHQSKGVHRSNADILRSQGPLFRFPFFQSSSADLETQAVFHSRFLVNFLYQECLVARDGGTKGFANFICHLQEFEPANFVLAKMLGNKSLERYLESQKVVVDNRSTHLTVRLAGVLAWFFQQQRLPEPLPTSKRRTRRSRLPCPTSPALPDFDDSMDEIKGEILGWNSEVFSHVQELTWSTASCRKKMHENEFALPLTGKVFKTEFDERQGPIDMEGGGLGKNLKKNQVRSRARSPFATISGSDDKFSSLQDLATSARSLVHMDMNSFFTTAAPIYNNPEEEAQPTNSWLLDLMLHRNLPFLTEDNGITPPAAFKLLEQTREFVEKVLEALQLYTSDSDYIVERFKDFKKELDIIREKAISKKDKKKK